MLFGRCTRKLTFRWALLGLVLAELPFLIFWAATARLPMETKTLDLIQTGHGLAPPLFTLGQPVMLTRLIDPAFAAIPMALLAWVTISKKELQRRWPRGSRGDTVLITYVFGLIFGVCGLVIVFVAFLGGLIIGATICSAFILLCSYAFSTDSDSLWERTWTSFMTELVALDVIWLGATLVLGWATGLIFLAVGLAVALTVHFGLYGLGVLSVAAARHVYEPFRRTMLVCEHAEEQPVR